jgi:hypothetical protein
MLWPYIVLRVCLAALPLQCEDRYLPVNIEDRGLLSPEAVELTCQMTFFRTAFLWGREHPRYRVVESKCVRLDPELVPKDM